MKSFCMLPPFSATRLCLLGAAFFTGFVSDAATAEDPITDQLIGRWEATREISGQRLRYIKEVQPGYETVSVYMNGELYRRWRVAWRVEPLGDYLLYRYSAVDAAEGEESKTAKEKSYLLRIEGDKWHEVHGMEWGGEKSPRVQVYTRLRPPEA